MRHKLRGRKFNRTKAHRKAMFMNLMKALIQHEQIKTTLPKAKDLRPVIEKLVTKVRNGIKENALATRRYALSILGNDETLVEKLMGDMSKRFANRNGGYTRVLKAGFRYGDNAPMAVIEFVADEVEVVVEKKVKPKPAAKAAPVVEAAPAEQPA